MKGRVYLNNNFEESSSEESGNMVEAITTGVFHVPVDNQAPDSNDMINIYFKNPSSKTLTANFLVEFSSPGVAPGVQNPEISSPPNGNWTVTVLPHHTPPHRSHRSRFSSGFRNMAVFHFGAILTATKEKQT